jgi:hypothetical protein
MNGFIKKSRTLDSVALSMMIDSLALGFLAYSPEQLGITIPLYAALRIGINILQAWLRFQTTGAVGEGKE